MKRGEGSEWGGLYSMERGEGSEWGLGIQYGEG